MPKNNLKKLEKLKSLEVRTKKIKNQSPKIEKSSKDLLIR